MREDTKMANVTKQETMMDRAKWKERYATATPRRVGEKPVEEDVTV